MFLKYSVWVQPFSAVSSALKTALLPPPPSPCWPIPISISSEPNSAMGSPVCGCVHPVSATASVAISELKSSAILSTSSRLLPSSAAAPATFISGIQPAKPRRSCLGAPLPAFILSISPCRTRTSPLSCATSLRSSNFSRAEEGSPCSDCPSAAEAPCAEAYCGAAPCAAACEGAYCGAAFCKGTLCCGCAATTSLL